MNRLCRALRIALILQAFLPATTTASSILSESLTKSAKGQNVLNVLEYQPVRETSCENASVCHISLAPVTLSHSAEQPTGPIDTTSCDYETVDSVNEDLFENLHELVATPFFKYFQARVYHSSIKSVLDNITRQTCIATVRSGMTMDCVVIRAALLLL